MEKKILCKDPYIYIIDNYISTEYCNHFIELSKSKLQTALVAGDMGGFISQGRTGKNCWIPHKTDHITEETVNQIAKLVEYPIENAESFQIIYYDTNGEYKNHYDAWKFDKTEKSARCLLRGGQRMVTALVYLNDVEEGGSTKFTKLNISVEPKKGRILVFENCLKNTNIVHPMSEHAGTPVLRGEKYAFNLWFRQQDRTKDYIHQEI